MKKHVIELADGGRIEMLADDFDISGGMFRLFREHKVALSIKAGTVKDWDFGEEEDFA